jgi:putative oxidoreductase
MQMKIVVLIARILVGLVFFVFGLNGFLQFMKAPLPPGLAGQFLGALMQSHYVLLVSAFQVIGGALLLINRYVPLALTITGPLIVNILAFHAFLLPEGASIAIVVAILWGIIFYQHRQYFAGLFVQLP